MYVHNLPMAVPSVVITVAIKSNDDGLLRSKVNIADP